MADTTDPVEELVQAIKKEVSTSSITFSAKELADAGDIYERYGYGTARQFLIGRARPSDQLLVRVIDLVESKPGVIRPMRAYIIRKLNLILSHR
jgi:hypothetical protein